MSLCTPAFIYILLSSIGIIIIAYQNYGNQNLYCVGNVNCPVQSTTPVFVAKILYVLFWTFILNTLCSYGYYKLSWFILLLPFILFFVIVSVMGQIVSTRTTNMSGTGPSYMGQGQQQQQQQQQQQFYTYQQQAAAEAQQRQPQPRMQNQERNVAPPGSEQTHWFEDPQFAGNRYNADGSGGQYSSYSDYDHALDSRTKQLDKESHERGGKATYHY
jgi:hypothetical protein